MAKKKEVMERHDHGDALPLRDPQEVCGKGDDMLEVDKIGFLFVEQFQKDSVKEMVVIVLPVVSNPGQIIHHPGHSEPIPLLFG